MLELLLLLVTGIATGFINVMAGGGSTLSIPVMIFLGLPGSIANGTNRIAILAQNITAVYTFYREGFSNFKLSLSLAVCTIPGALVGSWLATKVDNQDFNALLAIVMLIIMVVMAIPQKKILNPDQTPSKARLVAGHSMMLLIGLWGGFIHIGVGFLLMPTLNRIMQLDLTTTNMHKVFIVLIYTVVALVVFSSQLELLWSYGIALAIGTSIGAWLATKYQIKKGSGVIKMTLNVIMVIFIIKLLFFS